MKSKTKRCKITLGGRSFVIGCEEDKREILDAAVNMVESRLEEVQKNGKVIGLDRCALLGCFEYCQRFTGRTYTASKFGRFGQSGSTNDN